MVFSSSEAEKDAGLLDLWGQRKEQENRKQNLGHGVFPEGGGLLV
jgi:hypothetical protein